MHNRKEDRMPDLPFEEKTDNNCNMFVDAMLNKLTAISFTLASSLP